MKISGITDGTSTTMSVAEKYVRSDEYDAGLNSDDQGSVGRLRRRLQPLDGFLADERRRSARRSDPLGRQYFADPNMSSFTANPPGIAIYNCFQFGSPHTSGINAVFADGSVHSINYDVDLFIFNALGTRAGTACGSGGPGTAEPTDLSAGFN